MNKSQASTLSNPVRMSTCFHRRRSNGQRGLGAMVNRRAEPWARRRGLGREEHATVRTVNWITEISVSGAATSCGCGSEDWAVAVTAYQRRLGLSKSRKTWAVAARSRLKTKMFSRALTLSLSAAE